MNLKRLRYFCEVATAGSFTQAATQLGIAQSALSMAIAKLEKEVGLQLINRAERKMVLTADGQVLFRHAQTILESVQEAERELQELKGVEVGTVNFGAPSMLSSYYLPTALSDFKKRYPGVRVNLIEAGTASLQQMLLDGELDLALIRCDRDHDQIRSNALFDEEVVACVPSSHPFAKQKAISLESFCTQPLVLFREGYFLREAVSSYSKKHRTELDIRFETNLVPLLKSLVVNEVGISTALSMIVKADDNLMAVPFVPPIPLYLGLGWKKSHYLSIASRAFMSHMQTALASKDY